MRSTHRIVRTPRRRTIAAAAAALLSSIGLATPSFAGFTPINANESGEPNQLQILDHVYGGSFTKDGNDFANGAITATRVDDSQDQIWSQTDAIVSARAVASFNTLTEAFGYFNGASGGSFHTLFTASGTGFNVSGNSGTVPMTTPYRLGRGGEGTLFSSNGAENVDQRDHLVTYAITGVPGTPANVQTWMLFWEDLPAPSSDFDFNDFVVEMKTDPPATASTPPLLIPLPPAAWTGLSGLMGLGLVGGIRRFCRSISIA